MKYRSVRLLQCQFHRHGLPAGKSLRPESVIRQDRRSKESIQYRSDPRVNQRKTVIIIHAAGAVLMEKRLKFKRANVPGPPTPLSTQHKSWRFSRSPLDSAP